MHALTSIRLGTSVIALVGFLVACGGNGDSPDSGHPFELADPAHSSVEVAPSENIPADGRTPAVATVTLKDSEGKALGDQAVQVTGADLQVEPTLARTDASGVARFQITSAVPGPKRLDVLLNPGTAQEQKVFQKGLSFSALSLPFLVFEQQPADIVAGETISPVTVRLVDANGDTVDTAAPVTVRLKNSVADLFGTTTVASVNGVATFGNLSVWKSGRGLVLEASASGVTSNASTSFDVVPSVATGLAFRNAIPRSSVRAPLSGGPGIVVDLVDTYGNRGAVLDHGVRVRVRLEGGNGAAQLGGGGELMKTVASGESQTAFNDLSVDQEGTSFVLVVEESGGGSAALYPTTSNAFDVVDDVLPASPAALVTVDSTQTSLQLVWTAPGDDDLLGDISSYELRYSTTMLLSEADFLAATEVLPAPPTASAGTMQSFEVTGLDPDTLYYFGLRAKDAAGNASPLALVSGSTLPDGCIVENPCTTPPPASCVGGNAIVPEPTATCTPAAQAPWFECAPYETTETVCAGDTPLCQDGACVATLCPANIEDGDLCTVDTCDPMTGIITHVAVNVDDNDACTVDACDPVTGLLSHTAVDIDDGNACTLDACDPIAGITHTPVDLDDNDPCTADSCDPVSGVAHAPVDVDDGIACTVDLCTAEGITHTPNDAACAQGETCSATGCAPIGDLCENVTCTSDAPTCTPDSLGVVTYAGACDSNSGQCVQTPTESLCTDGVCLNAACVTARAPAAGELLLTELMHSPTNGTTQYFELFNSTAERLNLADVTVSLGQGNASFTLPSAPLLVEPNGYFVFAGNMDLDTNGGVSADAALPAGFDLASSGELDLSLDGASIAGFVWTTDFPQTPGRSMNLSGAVLTADAAAHPWYWCDSSNPLTGGDWGTPGAANDACGVSVTAPVDACAIQYPRSADWTNDSLNLILPVSETISSRFHEPSVTDRNTSGNDFYPYVEAEFGFGTTADVALWTWSAADWNLGFTTSGNDDERQATFAPDSAGVYSYGFRYRIFDPVAATWSGWTYCDENAAVDPITGTPTWGTVTVQGSAVPTAAITSVDYPVIAHGARLVLTGTGFTGATTVSVGGVLQAFSVTSDTEIVVPALDDATPIGAQDVVVDGSAGFPVTVIHLVINELDADTPGTDALEFVEISTGVPFVDLTGYTLVLWNGANTGSAYLELPLTVSDANGLLLVGNSGVSPKPAITFPNNTLQNGPDGAALYQAAPGAFPIGRAVSTSPVPLDALVYDTDDSDVPALLNALLWPSGDPRRVQVNENGTSRQETVSIARCGAQRRDGQVFSLAAPTPGVPNTCP